MELPRVYPILDTQSLANRGCSPMVAAAAWIKAGAGIMQFRHKGHWPRAVFEQAQQVARLCRDAGVLFLVDDRADFAMLLGAGLHLGQDDLPPSDARCLLGPDAVIGFSTHNREQLIAAANEPATYIALGPIFSTSSKENPDPTVGLSQLNEWRALTVKPLVAIGGITRTNAKSVICAGADSVAVIAGLLPDPTNDSTLRARMEEWQQLLTV